MNIDFVTQGKILGAEVYRDSSMVVQAVIDQEYRATLGTHDIRTIWISLLFVAIIVIFQIIGGVILRKKGSGLQIGKWVLYAIFDLLLFVLVVAGQAYVNYKILKIEYPQEVQVERLGESLVRVRWQTYDQTLGILVWNYEGESSQFEVDCLGEEKKRAHEVMIEVEPQKKIEFYLMVGEKKYGQSESEPYQVDAMSTNYQLEEIKIDAK